MVNNLTVEKARLSGQLGVLERNKTSSPLSYARVAASGGAPELVPVKKKKDQKILVKPKNIEECGNSEEVKMLLQKELDSCKNEIRVKFIRKLKNKAILMELNDTKDMEIIKKKLESSDKLTHVVPGRIGPRIIIYDVPKSMSEEELVKNIVSKNLKGVVEEEDLTKEIKVLFKMKSSGKYKSDNKHNVVLSVCGRVFKSLRAAGRIFVGFNSFRVDEFISLTRCFKCQGYGHTAKVCQREKLYAHTVLRLIMSIRIALIKRMGNLAA